jgi:hypothetical protein
MSVRSDVRQIAERLLPDGQCPGQYEQGYPEGGVWYIREGQPEPEIPLCSRCGERHMKPEDEGPHVVIEVVVRSREEARKYTEANL